MAENRLRMDAELDGIFLENTSIDYDYDYKGSSDSNGSEAVWIPVLLSLVFVIGSIGNAVLLWVLVQRRRRWRLSDICVFHLSLADVLLLLTLPLWTAASKRMDWMYGLLLCKIVVAVYKINFYCGISILLGISLKRYLAVVHKKLYRPKNSWLTKLLFLLVWIIPVLLTIPDWVALVFEKKDPWVGKEIQCVPNFYNPGWRLPSRLLHSSIFVVSALITGYSCVLVWLQYGCKQKQKNTSDVITLTLASVFIACWTPYNVTLILDTFSSSSAATQDAYKDSTSKSAVEVALTVTFALSCVHACLRPLLYVGLCRTFREVVLDTFRCKRVKAAQSMWELDLDEENLPSQSYEREDLKQTGCNEHQLQTIQC